MSPHEPHMSPTNDLHMGVFRESCSEVCWESWWGAVFQTSVGRTLVYSCGSMGLRATRRFVPKLSELSLKIVGVSNDSTTQWACRLYSVGLRATR